MPQFAKDAFVRIGADTRDLQNGLAKAKADANKFARDTLAIGAKLTALSAAGFAGVGIAARSFAELDAELRAVQGIAGATDEQMEALTETVRQLGASTSFTSLEVADAAKNLARAGLSTQEVSAALRDTLTLARSAGVEIADASAIASRALRQFAIDAENSQRVVDVLAKAANSGAFDLIDLGETLKFIGPIARGVGQSIEEVAGVTATLANQGLRGGIAGRQYKRLLIELSDVEKQAKLAALGVTDLFDGLGRLNSPTRIFEQLNGALGQLTDQQRLATLDEIFGEAAPVAQALSDNFDTLAEKIKELESESRGYAQTNADLIDKGLLGQFKILISAVTDLGIELGEIFGKQLELGIKLAVEAANAVKDWVSANEDLIKTIIPILSAVGALGLVLGSLGGVAAVIAGLSGTFSVLAGAAATVGVGLGSAAAPLAAVVAGFTILGLALTKIIQFARGEQNNSALLELFNGVTDAIQIATDAARDLLDVIVRVASLGALNLDGINLETFQRGAEAGRPANRATAELERLEQLFTLLNENDGKFLDEKQLEEFKSLLTQYEKAQERGLGLTFNPDGSVSGDREGAAGDVTNEADRQRREGERKRLEGELLRFRNDQDRLRRGDNSVALPDAFEQSGLIGYFEDLPGLIEETERRLADLSQGGGDRKPLINRGISGTQEEQDEARSRVANEFFRNLFKPLVDAAKPLTDQVSEFLPELPSEEEALKAFRQSRIDDIKRRRAEEQRQQQELDRAAADQARGIVGRIDSEELEGVGQFGTRGLGQRLQQKTLTLQQLLVDETKVTNQLLEQVKQAILNGTLVVG